MLISIQIPIIDARGFVDSTTRLLRPGWPAPEVGGEFVRAFGPVRRRPSGGLNGWLGEAAICDASKGVRFYENLQRDSKKRKSIGSIHAVYRRFFFDGLATGKIEIGLQIRPKKNSSNISEVVSDSLGILMQGWIEKNWKGKTEQKDYPPRSIGVFGTDFAKMYVDATTPHGVNLEDVRKFVVAGRPCVIVENSGRSFEVPKFSKEMNRYNDKLPYTKIMFWHQTNFGQEIPVWNFFSLFRERREDIRKIRIYLSRFHAESEAFGKILSMINLGKIKTAPYTNESQSLQKFFLDNLNHQRRDGKKIDNFIENDYYIDALKQRDGALPGYYDGLVSKLEQMEMRKKVNFEVFSYIKRLRDQDRVSSINIGEFVMNKVTNNGIAGNVGVTISSSTSNITANQTVLGSVNKPEIEELKKLAEILTKQASNPDEEVAAQAVSSAAEKLAQGNESAALAWLKRSGKWALTVAENVGAKLAAELIVRASM